MNKLKDLPIYQLSNSFAVGQLYHTLVFSSLDTVSRLFLTPSNQATEELTPKSFHISRITTEGERRVDLADSAVNT